MKYSNIYNLILPNKFINLFIYSLVIFGVISGSIFLVVSNDTDKASVIEQITNFFVNINANNINNVQALRNSLIINYIFVISIFVLGFSIIGVVINIFMIYLKGFLVGFSLSSLFLTYSYKGWVAAVLYTVPSQLLNIIVISILGIYSIMFSKHLVTIITSKKAMSSRRMLKKYGIIFWFSVVVTLISSVLEVYLFPIVLKFVISIYV